MPATQDHHAAPPSPAGSSTSDGSSSNSVSTGPPQTPVSVSLPMPTFMNFTGEESMGGVKRTSKTTRRVNTAERRATHNAVERQRRETLNGRFLDLAALLSNLHQIRRPSKSSIVNSSIAHLNASRRHRMLASQQLRMMKTEADALRHEVNEWRMRAGAAGVEEPMRGDAFAIVIRGELEFEAGDMVDADDGEEDEEGGGGNMYGGRQYAGEPASYADEAVEYALLHHQQQQQLQAEMLAAQMQAPFAHTNLRPPPPYPQTPPSTQGIPRPLIIIPPRPSPTPASPRSKTPQWGTTPAPCTPSLKRNGRTRSSNECCTPNSSARLPGDSADSPLTHRLLLPPIHLFSA
ncbi:hypothetical protein B0H17DRAFT_1007818 [Mycena rosella]|uniref:BHLH domain-containing protein n=1 Tax=Mycena rosella TaxID=1033263 RepID=A0AAD7DRS5_MYCRO|nr:hypothetical protein B0H17DRAFT_1007818 [Mycena rosella]